MSGAFTDEDRKAVLKSAKAQPFLIRGLISVAVLAIVSTTLGLVLVKQVGTANRESDVREARSDRETARRDAQAAGQRAHLLALIELQHECSLPARPEQHETEPAPHVHECWDEAAGAILKVQQDQLTALTKTAKDTQGVVNFLNSPARQKALADALASIRRSTEEAQAAVLSRTTLEVRDPARPNAPPLQVRPIIAPAPDEDCKPPVQLGEIGVGQGVICRDP